VRSERKLASPLLLLYASIYNLPSSLNTIIEERWQNLRLFVSHGCSSVLVRLFSHPKLLRFLVNFAFRQQRRRNDDFYLLHFAQVFSAQGTHTGL
jgi:hypothetical protein